MILFRALSEYDLKYINDGKEVMSTLCYEDERTAPYGDNRDETLLTYINICLNGLRKHSLNMISGHINGAYIDGCNSPFISLTSDFSIAANEYSIPQTGNNNKFNNRKCIAIFDIPDDKILKDNESVKRVRDSYEDDFVVDLRNHQLKTLFDNDIIQGAQTDEALPALSKDAYLNRTDPNGKLNIKGVNGISGYAVATKELLAYKRIKKEYMVTVLSPSLIDVFYSMGINLSIENVSYCIKNNLDKFEEVVARHPSNLIGTNILDCMEKDYINYENKDEYDIEKRYEYIKKQKRLAIEEIIKDINESFGLDLRYVRSLDDGILVRRVEDLLKIKTAAKHDVLMVQSSKKVYRFKYTYKMLHKNEDYDQIINHNTQVKLFESLTDDESLHYISRHNKIMSLTQGNRLDGIKYNR